MYKLLVLCVASFVLAGCASSAVKPLDKRCDSIGLYARSVVTLRDVGMPLAEVNKHAIRGTRFPYRGIAYDAYGLKTKTPADAYVAFYQMCTSVGYSLMVETFAREEQIRLEHERLLNRERVRAERIRLEKLFREHRRERK